MKLKRHAKSTLTPIELDHGDTFRFVSGDGAAWEMTLRQTSASVLERLAKPLPDGEHFGGDVKVYGFAAVVEINGKEHTLQRQVGSQASFYEPWVIDGVRLWFDAARCAFMHPPGRVGVIHEKDWAHRHVCSPTRAARFVVQQADRAIAPEPIGEWFVGQKPAPDIRECYLGEDCWMGPYNGGAAHCGLDINMLKGTVLTAPIALDDQYVFNGAEAGHGCTRWRGTRRWSDGSEWMIHTHHLQEMLVPQRCPIARGTAFAKAAGTGVGAVEHSHFMFRVIEQGGDYYLDPWILFWAARQDALRNGAKL
jgi:hypothetical protein